MKNKSVGFYLTIITLFLAVAALVCYITNCRTAYFANYGISKSVVICMAAGAAAELIVMVSGKGTPKIWKDFFPVAGAVLLMTAAIQFTGLRINEAAFIMTFQKNASNVADLQSAIAGIACCLVASLTGMCAAFFDVEKSV